MAEPPRHPCVCCGFVVFTEPVGSYDICPLCGWEDDGVQARAPGYAGGANVESLCTEQAQALRRFPPDLQMAKGFARASGWRPLRPEECSDAELPGLTDDWHYWIR